MRLVLDSGGVTALAGDLERAAGLRRRGLWPPTIPSVVLSEALTGDPRRDHAVNRFLRGCIVRDVDELHAREAARVRTATGRAGTVSAVDAIVAAFAGQRPESVVVTSDPADLRALGEHTASPFAVLPV